MKAPFYERPAISRIAEDLKPYRSTLYIGGSEGARDLGLLAEHGISIVVNCAVNLDINFVQDAAMTAEGGRCATGHAPIRYYKLGMIDGSNPEKMMLGAYYILLGAMQQQLPKRETYPYQDGGNVLVNCRGGRSRSVSLVALFLHKQQPELFSTLDSALKHIRIKRELRPDEWFETPKPMLYEAARKASEWIDLIEGTSCTSVPVSVHQTAIAV
ncbi:MAG: dual specificity protein phosphatase family protein [Phyllobacterium sp.]